MPKLTRKQKEFADEYIRTGNGTQSALKAYDTTDRKTAGVIAVENLTKPSVADYLQENRERAKVRMVELSEQNKALPVAFSATKDILDRTERVEEGNKNLNLVWLQITNNGNVQLTTDTGQESGLPSSTTPIADGKSSFSIAELAKQQPA
jgi:phage terminase small subunit